MEFQGEKICAFKMVVKLLDYAPARLFQNTLEPKMSKYKLFRHVIKEFITF